MTHKATLITFSAIIALLLVIATLGVVIAWQNVQAAERDHYEHMREVCQPYYDKGDLDGMVTCRQRFGE